MRCADLGLLERDGAGADETRERFLQRDHPGTFPERNLGVEVLHALPADVLPHRVVGEQDLDRRNPASAIGARDELLADDGVQGQGELLPHLPLLESREDVDDAMDRLRSVSRVKR